MTSQTAEPDEAVIADYLANRLAPAQADAFEAYCLSHPEFGRRVEMDLYLKVGLTQIQAGRSRQLRQRRNLALAVAATLVCFVVGVQLLHPGARADSLVAYGLASDVPAPLLSGPRMTVTLLRLREGSPLRRIQVPRQAGIVAIRLAPDSPAGSRGYKVEAAVDSGLLPPSVALDQLHADGNGYIEMYLPVTALVGHTLKMSVSPSPSMGTDPLSFRLQVDYAPPTPTATP